MTPTPFTATVGAVPKFVAGPGTALAVLRNTGSAPARIVTESADPDHGRTIAPGATIELEPTGRFIWLACDTTTTVEVTCYTLDELRENAAAEFRIPVELLRGKSKAAIADFVVAYYAHEVAE
jgi:hypothetical protein